MAISVLIMIASVLGMILAQDLFLKIVAIVVFVIAAISLFVREIKLYNKIRILERAVAVLCKENSSDPNKD